MSPRLDHLDAAKNETIALGFTFHVERTQRHFKFYVVAPDGRQRMVTISLSPSDHRVLHRVRSDIRNAVKFLEGKPCRI